MPDDVAEEKVKALLALGAHVERVRPASIVDKKQVRAASFANTTGLIIFCCSSLYALIPRAVASWADQ